MNSKVKLEDLFERRFTKDLKKNESVYDLFEWKTCSAEMKNFQTGEILYRIDKAKFPKYYSQNACNIIASKYFKRDTDEDGLNYVADRLVGFWADALMEEGLIKNRNQWNIFYDELVFAFLSQMWAPNSPQWFNTGIKRSYGIAGGSDHLYYYDENKKEVVESEDRYSRTQASACFILSVEDSLLGVNSISDHFISETKLFKGGSGVGSNFSTLRGINEKLSSGGYSSGMMSFLYGLDRNAGSIKSGGVTRRSAKMVVVDVDHPEINEFVEWKVKEEDKIRDLGKMGYDTSIQGEAHQTVSGQNSNNSVRMNYDFMNKVIELKNTGKDSKFELKGRVDSSVNREVSTKELWNSINEATWKCGDPGLQFDDTFNAWHTCPLGENGDINDKRNRINSTNPCSEYAFLDDTSCNLASINIYNLLNKNDMDELYFSESLFSHLVGLIQLVLEASIFKGQFPTKDVARKSYMFRTTGLGIANAASVLMAFGYPYDSIEGRNLIAGIVSLMTAKSYFTSSLMASKIGSFEKFELNREPMLKVIRNHTRIARVDNSEFEGLNYNPIKIDHYSLEKENFKNLSNSIKYYWEKSLEYGEKYGYRNAQVTVIAPTGTISFAMDCGATSIEPFYSNVSVKKMVDGGVIEVMNPIMKFSLHNLNYTDSEIKDIVNYITEKDENGYNKHTSLAKAPHLLPEDIKIFETANEISPEGHVLMVSAITPNISGSVSKTINLPESATVEDIKNANILAYETGTKAIAIYRDNCKSCQPLTTGMKNNENDSLDNLTYKELLDRCKNNEMHSDKDSYLLNRIRPDGMRKSQTHSAKLADIEMYITIGYYPDGKMAEIFVSTDKEGTIVKGLLASLSKSLSHMLQYGISPEQISKMLRGQRYEPSGFVSRHPYIKYASSVSDLISKIIDIECNDFTRCQVKPDISEESKNTRQEIEVNTVLLKTEMNNSKEEKGEVLYGEYCSNCGSDRMIRNGTCKVCMDCGSTTGCS